VNPEIRMAAHVKRRMAETRPMKVRGITLPGLARAFEPDLLPQVIYANVLSQIFVGCPLALTTPMGDLARCAVR
jgi:hypothetical protein